MLNIEQLSFWERKEWFEQIDFLVVGAGIVGCSTALHLKRKHKNAKVLVVERGFLPCGASSKNAGFASFGGPVELLDDMKNTNQQLVWETVQARYDGLQYLRELIGDEAMDFKKNGGWDLLDQQRMTVAEEVRDQLSNFNREMERISGAKNVFSEDKAAIDRFGFSQLATSFHIAIEGQIDTGKMIRKYHQLLIESGVLMMHGVEVKSLEIDTGKVLTNIGEISAEQLFVTVNGFASTLLPNEDVLPARAQVLVTSPIPNLKLKGTFHFDNGYYYFRNFENRVLLGGARNLDIDGETTIEMVTTELIQNRLKELLNDMILPGQDFSIDYQWSGVMGVGSTKYPIIKRVSNKVAIGVRLGGIGVALGTNVGKKLADLA